MMCKAAEINLLANHAPANEHLIGASAGLQAPPLRSPQHGWRKGIPQAVEFEGRTGLAMPEEIVVIRS